MPWWGRTDGRKKWVFPVAFVRKSQYRIALSCAEKSVPTGLGEIKQPCPRPLSGRGVVPNFFSSSAYMCGKIQSNALLAATFCTHYQTRKDSKSTTARGDDLSSEYCTYHWYPAHVLPYSHLCSTYFSLTFALNNVSVSSGAIVFVISALAVIFHDFAGQPPCAPRYLYSTHFSLIRTSFLFDSYIVCVVDVIEFELLCQ